MFALCARCRKPASLETAPEADYVCPACTGLPLPPAPPPPDVERPRPGMELRHSSAELWARRRREGRIAIALIVAIGVALVALMTWLNAAPSGVLSGLMLFGCFLVYTFAVWYAVRQTLPGDPPVWKCAILGFLLCTMQIVALYAVARGDASCGSALAAMTAIWFVYSMIFRSFFRATLRNALAITAIIALVAFTGTVAFLCAGGFVLNSIAR